MAINMNKKKTIALILLIAFLVSALAGCGKKQETASSAAFLEITDDTGKKVKIKEKPERVVILSDDYISIYYALGGKIIGRPSTAQYIPQEALAAKPLGHIANLNLEELTALKPDLVIGRTAMHENLGPALEASGIPLLLLNMRTHQDTMEKVKLMGKILGNPQKAEEINKGLEQKIGEIVEKKPEKKKKALIIYASAREITVENETSVTGGMLKLLGAENIAAGSIPLKTYPTRSPFSLEKVVEENPDVIVVTVMGSLPEIKERIQADLGSNPSFQKLKAVKEGRVHYLPPRWFLYNPALEYPQALAYLAQIIYPEVYGSLEEKAEKPGEVKETAPAAGANVPAPTGQASSLSGSSESKKEGAPVTEKKEETPKTEQKESRESQGESVYFTLTDDAGRKVTLAHKPLRIVSLSTSYLTLLDALEVNLLARVSTMSKVPARYEKIDDVGHVANVNLEKLVALKPDLVLGVQDMQENLVPALESAGIPVLLLKMKTLEEVKEKTLLFGRIAGQKEKANRVVTAMNNKVEAIAKKVPATGKKVALLHATAKDVTLSLENSIPGDVAKILKLVNIAEGKVKYPGKPERTPFSMEVLVAENPDVILISSMGSSTDVQLRLVKDVESNPAWSGLKAVKNKQVFTLPGNMFLTNPGTNYPEAVEYMAKLVYPELFR